MPATPQAHQRNAGLDATRALAILMVLFAHNAYFIGAWTHHKAPIAVNLAGPFGVELFFILSGFLIGNLLQDIAETAPTARNMAIFLIRRWLRTLPLYFLWLAVLLIAAPPTHRYAWHVLHYATLTQNLSHGMPPGDFFPVSWSLTIEEWFYLLFAVAALGATILTRARLAYPAAIAAFLILPALARWYIPLTADYENAIEKVALLNLDSIARGVLLAALLRHRRVPAAAALPLALLGLSLIGMIWTGHWQVSAAVFRTFLTTVIGIGWALCLPLMLLWQSGPAFIRRLSQYAYGLYITHYTVLEHAHEFLPTPLAITAGIVLPFILAALSWHFLESPILRLRPRQRYT
jgi:peptidoglycan/LPS O-acetylase OafA/YrhL